MEKRSLFVRNTNIRLLNHQGNSFCCVKTLTSGGLLVTAASTDPNIVLKTIVEQIGHTN